MTAFLAAKPVEWTHSFSRWSTSWSDISVTCPHVSQMAKAVIEWL
ncbi:hypothetical protein ACVINZ_002987 [Mesorhizobium jarvisii]